jgi:hypothetical protein
MDIDDLRERVCSGQYQVRAEDVAKAMMEWLTPTSLEEAQAATFDLAQLRPSERP